MGDIHESGQKRHPDDWFLANRVARYVTMPYGLNDKQLKEMVPLIVLRVLDACKPTLPKGPSDA